MLTPKTYGCLVILFISLAGCASPTREGTGVPWPGPRTDARDEPIALVHGFSFGLGAPSSKAETWTPLSSALRQSGWSTGIERWGYYGCDAGFEKHASAFGSHAAHAAAPGAHEANECSPQSHNRDTPIEHLAYHWAWGVYETFTRNKQCIDVVAHSMGGLIVRYAVARTELKDPDFPPGLCIEDIVTLGTPHAGSTVAAFCAATVANYQCQEMTAGSELLNWLATYAQNPQTLRETDWTVVASDNDDVVDSVSALAMAVPHKVRYLAKNGISHQLTPNYMEAVSSGLDAVVGFLEGTGTWQLSRAAPWPGSWIDHSLVSTWTGWAQPTPNTGPAAEGISPAVGSYTRRIGQGFEVEVECTDDPEGDAAFVDFMGNGKVLETDQDLVGFSPSFTFAFTAAGSFQLSAVCRDEFGAQGQPNAPIWNVEVTTASGVAPTLTRVSPAESATLQTGQSLTFRARAEDVDGNLDRTNFYSNGALQDYDGCYVDCTYDDASWTASFQTPGTFTITARSLDSTQRESPAVTWTVQVNSPTQTTAPGGGRTLASNAVVAVPAGQVFAHKVNMAAAGTISYSFAVTDSSTLDVGIIRDSDLSTYQSGGSVSGWATATNVQQKSATASVPAGVYDFVLKCKNTTFDCDLQYSLSANP